MKLLVCGGRHFNNGDFIESVLNNWTDEIELVIQGGASGADLWAQNWADMHEIPCLNVPACWLKYGKAAGYIRNKKMLTYGPDAVLAFPGGKGTANMLQVAKESGVACYVASPETNSIIRQKDRDED